MKSKKAFTLIEIIIVLSIISIVLSVAIVKFNFFYNYKEKNEINLITDYTNFAKQKALVTGYDVTLYLHNEKIEIKSAYCEDSLNLKYLRFPATRKRIIFTSSGGIYGADTISIRGNKNNYSLVITPVSAHIRIK